MKINLIDDTALIETTSTKNVLEKDRTILGLRNSASNSIVRQEVIKTSGTHKKRSSRPHVCGNVRMNQENGNVGFTERVKFQENEILGFHCGNKKVTRGCGLKQQESFEVEENVMVKSRESGHLGDIEQERKFRDDENVGSSLKKQECYDGNGFEEEPELMDFTQRVKIQEKVSSRNCCLIGAGNMGGNEKGMLGIDTKQEMNSKTIQVWVARGKVHGNNETTLKDGKVSTIEMLEVQSENESGRKIMGTLICYSRKQMEDLRFVNMEKQNKKWCAIYSELGPAVKKEYDGLLDCSHHHHHHSHLDINRKVTAHGILGVYLLLISCVYCSFRRDLLRNFRSCALFGSSPFRFFLEVLCKIVYI